MRIKLAINKNIVNKGDPRSSGWVNAELSAEEIAEHICAGFAISQGVLKAGAGNKKPTSSDIEFAQLLPIDIDNDISVYDPETKGRIKRRKTIEEGYFPFDIACADVWLCENALMLHTTCSHTEEHHRFRIIFALETAIFDIKKYSETARVLIEKLGGDASCKNIDRMFFGNNNAELVCFGNYLFESELRRLEKIPNAEKKELKKYADSGNNGQLTAEQVAEMLACIPKQMFYDDWGKIVSAVGNYFDEDTAVRLIEEWSPDEKLGTRYKIRHRSKKPQIASVVYFAKQYGYDTSKLYNRVPLNEVTPNGEIVERKAKRYEQTELGNSEKFLDAYGNKVRHNYTSGKWLIWNGKHWEVDLKNKIMQLGKKLVQNMLKESFAIIDEEKRKAWIAHALKSQSKPQIKNMLELASSHEKVAIIHSDLDSELYMFNCQNGTYDLQSNTFHKHDPNQLLSKCAGANFDPNAECPAFEAALDTMFDYDRDLIAFIQRALGLSLCGAHLEEILFFCYGKGKNGKSVFFQVVNMVFGDYFQKAPTEMLMNKPQDNIPNDIALLPGARLVVTEELPENRSLNEQKIKNLTGGDTISARFLHKEFFTFMPTHTQWMFGNHKPVIRGNDEGIWRRICLIPFLVTIPDEERRPHQDLMADFEVEKDGILNWIIEGWKSYREMGLNPPHSVQKATKEYRDENDVISEFVCEYCELKTTNKIKASDLLKCYNEYCTETKEYALTKKKFYARIESLDGVRGYISGTKHKYFEGIDLNSNYRKQTRTEWES